MYIYIYTYKTQKVTKTHRPPGTALAATHLQVVHSGVPRTNMGPVPICSMAILDHQRRNPYSNDGSLSSDVWIILRHVEHFMLLFLLDICFSVDISSTLLHLI